MELRARAFALASVVLTAIPACAPSVESLAAIEATTGGVEQDTSSTSSTTGSAGGDTGGAGAGGAGGGPAAGPPQVRFANLRNLPPFDVCHGFEGQPLLGALGLAGGLAMGQVSRYLPAAPAGVPWTHVAAGSPCSEASDFTFATWPEGASEGAVTMVPAMWCGEGCAVTARGYLDELRNNHYGINLRALTFMTYQANNPDTDTTGAPSVNIVEQESEPQLGHLFENLEFGEVATKSGAGPVSAAGYVETFFVSVGPLAAYPAAYAGPVETKGFVPIPGGAEGNAYGVGSIFVIGAAYGDTGRVIVCADNAPPQGALSECTVFP